MNTRNSLDPAGFAPLVRVGLIGVHGMGWSNLSALLKDPRTQVTALCDVDQPLLQQRMQELGSLAENVRTYRNYEDLLQYRAVDAVIIGTPDHWHCLQMIEALRAGKHVYVEKPIGNSVRECEAMVAAAQKYPLVVQVGQWQRSQQHFRDAMAYVHSGQLGKIRLVKAWSYVGWKEPVTPLPDTAPPEGVDYSRWLGPAPARPFNANRFHFQFRWYWDYAGGLMTDWGVHMLDYALLGMQVSDPLSVMAAGGNLANPDGAAETPDTLTVIYQFPTFNIQWEHTIGIDGGPYGKNHGVAFIGDKGTLVLNRKEWEVFAEEDRMPAVPPRKMQENGLEKHMANFVDAIQRNDPAHVHAPIEAGAQIAIFSQLGNIAYRVGRKLFWEGSKRRFTDPEANAYLAPQYHNGYTFPKV